MPRTEHVTCDQCGVAKKDTNHWFIIRIGEAFHLFPWSFKDRKATDDSSTVVFVCGDSCATKTLAGFMSMLKSSATTD